MERGSRRAEEKGASVDEVAQLVATALEAEAPRARWVAGCPRLLLLLPLLSYSHTMALS